MSTAKELEKTWSYFPESAKRLSLVAVRIIKIKTCYENRRNENIYRRTK